MNRKTVISIALGLGVISAVVIGQYVPGCQHFTTENVEKFDAQAKRVLALFRAIVAAQPEGPRRTELLEIIDRVTTYEQFAAAIAILSAEGFKVEPPATQPTTQPAN